MDRRKGRERENSLIAQRNLFVLDVKTFCDSPIYIILVGIYKIEESRLQEKCRDIRAALIYMSRKI